MQAEMARVAQTCEDALFLLNRRDFSLKVFILAEELKEMKEGMGDFGRNPVGASIRLGCVMLL